MTVKFNCSGIKTTHKLNVKGYARVWFDKQAITNMLVLNNIKRKFRVTYNGNDDGLLNIHNPNGKYMHLYMHKYGIHWHYTKNHHLIVIQTVKEN